MTVFRKNVVLEGFNTKPPEEEGLEILHRKEENNEDYVSLIGTKQQINNYLQDAPIISERLRTLRNIPKYRIINSKVERIQ